MDQTVNARRKTKPSVALAIRQLHSYIAVLIAPSLLFFAVTGALQIYGLHQSRGAYRAPDLIQMLGAVHKNQVFELPHKDRDARMKAPRLPGDDDSDPATASDAAASGGAPASHHRHHRDADSASSAAASGPVRAAAAGAPLAITPSRPPPRPLRLATRTLKAFFLLVSVGLFASTLFGLYMALTMNRRKRVCLALLAAGIGLPLLTFLLP